MLTLVLALAVLAAAWSAGFFWTWSFTVMPGLASAPPEAAIAAMRAVNEGIRTAGFAFVFFGPALLAALAGGLGLAWDRPVTAWLALAAGALYAAGVVGITFAFNLPLNDQLARAVVTAETAGRVWADYAVPWTGWNHLRTTMATAALGLLIGAAIRAARD